jgi:hypothetical protein
MIKKRIVIASVPYTDTTAPIMAPAALKSVVEQAGHVCVAFDLNAEIVSRLHEDDQKWSVLDFFYFERVKSGIEPVLAELFEHMAQRILSHQPDLVALSLLHYQCQAAAKWLCFCLKRHRPDLVIVLGGTGIVGTFVSTDYGYCQELQKTGLIDHYIRGDGEEALIELLNENIEYPGINGQHWRELDNLDSLPYPNYDDYNFDLYTSPFIGILGSRGCVRQCTFCDVHEHWEDFRWRSGQNIFEEMLAQNKKYGSNFFKFQDSLINGNVKEYNALISLLADHNNTNPDNQLHWASYFIFRPQQQMSEEQWRMTGASGAKYLSVGIESLVDRNRHHIKKKFSNQDIEYSLGMAKKYGVKIVFIIMVGYVTETEQDHLDTLQWLQDNRHYAKDPIETLAVGGTVAILPNTWLDRNQKSLGVTWMSQEKKSTSGTNHAWEIKSTGNNYETRLRRLDEMIKTGEECGFKVIRAIIDPQKELENVMNDKMKEYYERSTRV